MCHRRVSEHIFWGCRITFAYLLSLLLTLLAYLIFYIYIFLLNYFYVLILCTLNFKLELDLDPQLRLLASYEAASDSR